MSKVARVREIIAQQAALEHELATLVGEVEIEESRAKAVRKCSICGDEGHSSRTCTHKNGAASETDAALSTTPA